MAKFTDGLISLGLVLLGLVLMATPLALWVAWTETIFYVVQAIGAVAILLYCIVVGFEKPPHADRDTVNDRSRTASAGERGFDDLHTLHPFIHHHRPFGGVAFRAVMERIRRRLYGTSC